MQNETGGNGESQKNAEEFGRILRSKILLHLWGDSPILFLHLDSPRSVRLC